jgi:hypothetical protein
VVVDFINAANMLCFHLAVATAKWAKCGDRKIVRGQRRSGKAFPTHNNNNINIGITIIIIIN